MVLSLTISLGSFLVRPRALRSAAGRKSSAVQSAIAADRLRRRRRGCWFGGRRLRRILLVLLAARWQRRDEAECDAQRQSALYCGVCGSCHVDPLFPDGATSDCTLPQPQFPRLGQPRKNYVSTSIARHAALHLRHGQDDLSRQLSLQADRVRGRPRPRRWHRQVQLQLLLEGAQLVDRHQARRVSIDLRQGATPASTASPRQRQPPRVLQALRDPGRTPTATSRRSAATTFRSRWRRSTTWRRPTLARRRALHERPRRRLVPRAGRDPAPLGLADAAAARREVAATGAGGARPETAPAEPIAERGRRSRAARPASSTTETAPRTIRWIAPLLPSCCCRTT